MKRKALLQTLAITFAAVLLFAAVFITVLLQNQRAAFEGESFVAEAAAPPAAAQVLAAELSPLTGLPLTDSVPRGQRITAVVVNNINAARPQSGLSDAQILIEAPVEGYITRFLALYDDYNSIEKVGPLRSARTQHFELVLPFQPLFISNGSNVQLNEMLAEYSYADRHLSGYENETLVEYDDLFWHDEERMQEGYPIENTTYTSGEAIAAAVEKYGLDDKREYNSGFFSFVPFGEPARVLQNAGGESINLPIGGALVEGEGATGRTCFAYNEQTGQYSMSQLDNRTGELEPTIDENNGMQLCFDNVVVLFVEIGTIGETELLDISYGGGVGFYYCGGRYEPLRWAKGGPLEILRLYTGDGTETPITVNPGTTYVGIVDIARAEYYRHGFPGQEKGL